MRTGASSAAGAVVTAVCAALLLGGCASSGAAGGGGRGGGASSSSPSGSSPTGVPGSTSPGNPGPGTITLGESRANSHLSVPVGTDVVVRLHSTYWRFGSMPGSAALARVSVRTHPGHSRIPGMGTGTVVATFHATAPGSATITASRISCGEAMRCSSQQSSYRVTVSVHG